MPPSRFIAKPLIFGRSHAGLDDDAASSSLTVGRAFYRLDEGIGKRYLIEA